jgi:hypothetical protein
VYYKVRGPEVGSVSVEGLAPGANAWYGFAFTIPSGWTPAGEGAGYYWAQVRDDGIPLTPWVGPQSFDVGFVSRFSGSTAPWVAVKGTWSNASNEWYYTPGGTSVHDRVSALYGNLIEFRDLDYRARFWLGSGSPFTSNCLVIRGVPGTLTGQGGWQSGYEFCYLPGVYIVLKNVAGTRTSLYVGYGSTMNLHTWNTLRVRAVGSQLTFWINGTEVWAGTDASLSSGRVGISKRGYGGLWVDDVVLTSGGVAPDAGIQADDTVPNATDRKPPK